MDLWVCKSVDWFRTNREPVQTGTRCLLLHFQYKDSNIYSGTGAVVELRRVYLKKGCVHIGGEQVAYLGAMPRRRV